MDEFSPFVGKKSHGACVLGFDADAIGKQVAVPGSNGFQFTVSKSKIIKRITRRFTFKKERIRGKHDEPFPAP